MTSQPPAADHAMARALEALDAAPDGWLALPVRRRLRAALGPWAAYETPGWPNAGVVRRAALLGACAERALPVWEGAFPADDRAAVTLSYDALDGDLDPQVHPPDREDSDLDEPQVDTLGAWATADDPEGPRAYWRWYVTEAFPTAYRAAP